MTATRKPRADATLKTLPEERQRQIIDYLRDHSIDETLVWLRGAGLETSSGALSQFYSWYQLKEQQLRQEARVEGILHRVAERKRVPKEELFQLGQELFATLAIEREDVKGWYLMHKVERERNAEEIARQKFRRETAELFVQWWEDKRSQEILQSAGSNAEKIERLGALMFGEDWKASPTTDQPAEASAKAGPRTTDN